VSVVLAVEWCDGGRSSPRRSPGLGGDGGPWRWLFVVVKVGPFLVFVIRGGDRCCLCCHCRCCCHFVVVAVVAVAVAVAVVVIVVVRRQVAAVVVVWNDEFGGNKC
jgi:hypothetical protein